MKVSSIDECEDFCSATDGCNAASYYLDGSAFGGNNCWLKNMDYYSCELPSDAAIDLNAVFLIMVDAQCTQLHTEPVSDASDRYNTCPHSCMMAEYLTKKQSCFQP